MQYTIRNIPRRLDRVLRAKAKAERKSLNEVTLETLEAGAGLTGQPVKRRDLSDIAGSWVEDPETEAVLREFDRIDPEKWR
jgi:hypothetical protein